MSQASEEYIHQSEVEQHGSITALPSPISQAQCDYICELVETSVLAHVQREEIYRLLTDGGLTIDQGNRLISALLDQQKNPRDRVRDGELLLKSDLKKAVRRAADEPNT